MSKQTIIVGTQTSHLKMNEDVHVFELTAVEPDSKEMVTIFPTWAQAQQIHDAIEKIMARLKRQQTEEPNVPINDILQMPKF